MTRPLPTRIYPLRDDAYKWARARSLAGQFIGLAAVLALVIFAAAVFGDLS